MIISDVTNLSIDSWSASRVRKYCECHKKKLGGLTVTIILMVEYCQMLESLLSLVIQNKKKKTFAEQKAP